MGAHVRPVDATGSELQLDAEYERILSAPTEEDALRLEAELLVETDKTFGPGDPKDLSAKELGDIAERALEGAAQLDRVLTRAASQIGYREGPNNRNKYGQWYGMPNVAWCAQFVSWVFYFEGLPLPATTSKGFARTAYGATWFQSQGRWRTSPHRGDVVFYDLTTSTAGIDHVGIVAGVNSDGSIQTIEGNTSCSGGEGVCGKTRRGGIKGYGIPAYQNGGGGGGGGGGVPPWPGRYLRQPPAMIGGDVRLWQERMKKRGWRRMVVDGKYDGLDENICRAFQREKSLGVDGTVGPLTWHATWAAPIT